MKTSQEFWFDTMLLIKLINMVLSSPIRLNSDLLVFVEDSNLIALCTIPPYSRH